MLDRILTWPAASAIVALSCLAFSAPLSAAEADRDRPNILLILADDVGSEVLECYGGQSYATPRLDQLAQEGLRFDHAYAMAVCHPTRITLLSGQYPFRLEHPRWGTYPKSAEGKTIAHLLANAGYTTAIAGKWQVALLKDDPNQPQRLGFQESCLFGWHEGPRYYQPHIWQNGELRSDMRDRYGPDVYCDFLIDFMSRERDKPFFAYYSMALCHAVTNDLEAPVPVGPNGRYQNYAEMVAAMDQRVGKLLDALENADLAENTLVLFFTDNGTPGKIITHARGNELVYRPVASQRDGVRIPGGKGQLTDAGTRVPLIARWPGRVVPGEATDELVDVSDFLPTLAELAQAPLATDRHLDGHSFAGVLRGSAGSERSWVFAEHKNQSFVKDRRWKLYRDGRFFDLATDTGECLALDSEHLPAAGRQARDRLQIALESLFGPGL